MESGLRPPRRHVLLGLMCLLSPASAAASPLSQALRERIESRIATSGAEVAVAFKLLQQGDELLLNPDESFHAASTMKVPVMIELYRRAAAGELRLDEKLPVSVQFASIVDGSPYRLSAADDSEASLYDRVGESVALRELCRAMIQQSSNLATNLLIERLGAERIRSTTEALGAPGMHVLRGVEDGKAFRAGRSNTTTARALLRLLEVIARREAVDVSSSEAMEGLLRGQHFVEGIPAGLPPGTPVSNKTGAITRIHHDAAIVRGPRPFVLVILTRGLDDREASAALMTDITRMFWEATQHDPQGVQRLPPRP